MISTTTTTTTTTKKDNTAVTDIIFYVHEKQSLVKHEINQVWLFLQFQHTSQDAKQDTVTGCLVSTKHRETAFRHLGFIVFDSWQRTNKVHRPSHLRSRIKAVQQQIVFWCHFLLWSRNPWHCTFLLQPVNQKKKSSLGNISCLALRFPFRWMA